MLDPAIQNFFQKRKEDWLNKKMNLFMDEQEIATLKEKAEEVFSLKSWLPDAAHRACSRAMTTHPCKFSHPSTGIGQKNLKNFTYVTPIIVKKERTADGFLKTGNVVSSIDSVGNAADLDVDEFLNLIMQDGDTLLTHIERESELAKSLLTNATEAYENLRAGLLAITCKGKMENSTSTKIKQVYFPINKENYHLLSILSSSGLIYELKNRVDNLRFNQKEVRDLKRKNEFSEVGYSEIFNITTIGYGGTKPQNISVLNNKNAGKARLLLSAPPQLEKRAIQFPKKDFFINSIRYHDIKSPLQKLHRIFQTGLDSASSKTSYRTSKRSSH